MEVRKESNGLKNSMVTREELAIINQFTKRALKEDEVYTFAVRLCDNEVDRDFERFDRAALEKLGALSARDARRARGAVCGQKRHF